MGKRVQGEDFGFVPETQEKPAAKPQDDFGFVPEQPKKKVESNGSSTTGKDISPAARYQQSINDYNEKAKGLEQSQKELTELKKTIDSQNVLQGDPTQVEKFKSLQSDYNNRVNLHNKNLKELNGIKALLDVGKEEYTQDNFKRQQKLFDQLGLKGQERQDLINKIYKQQYPDQAEDIDSGRLVPTQVDVDADDLAKMMTGKTADEIEIANKIKSNRPISDRIFGSFMRSAEKTLAFEMPAAAGGAINNFLSDLYTKDSDLEKSWLRPGIGNQFKKLISMVPGAKDAINETVEDARVDVFKWADEWRKKPAAVVPGIGGLPMVLQNDQNLIRSISQIESPLDVIDFVTSNAGQGLAQILPSILSRGTTSFIQEIGNNQLEGTIAIANKMSAEEGRTVTPEEVIRRGLDEPIIARNFGMVQGALDALGANKVGKAIGFDQFKKDIQAKTLNFFKESGKSAGTEFLTEGTQGLLQQVAVGKMTGLGSIEAVKNIDWFQVLDEGLAGAVGGGAVAAGGQGVSAAINRVTNFKKAVDKPVEELTEEQLTAREDLLDIIADTAKKYGDPRPIEEIKKFIQDEVVKKVPDPNDPPAPAPPSAGAVVEEKPKAPKEQPAERPKVNEVFKLDTGKNTEGERIEIPGLEKWDLAIVKDPESPMNFMVIDIYSGKGFTPTSAMNKEDAIRETVDHLLKKGTDADKLLERVITRLPEVNKSEKYDKIKQEFAQKQEEIKKGFVPQYTPEHIKQLEDRRDKIKDLLGKPNVIGSFKEQAARDLRFLEEKITNKNVSKDIAENTKKVFDFQINELDKLIKTLETPLKKYTQEDIMKSIDTGFTKSPVKYSKTIPKEYLDTVSELMSKASDLRNRGEISEEDYISTKDLIYPLYRYASTQYKVVNKHKDAEPDKLQERKTILEDEITRAKGIVQKQETARPTTSIEDFKAANPKTTKQISAKERIIAQHLTKFSSKSWARFGDPHFMSWQKDARFYLNNKGKGIDIDVQAKDISNLFDGTDDSITPGDIVQFVENYPNPKMRASLRNLKDEDLSDVVDQISDPEGPVPVLDEEYIPEEPGAFDPKKSGLLQALNDIKRWGITAENLSTPEIQEIFMNDFIFDETDRKNINAIFEYAKTEEGRQEITDLSAERARRTRERLREKSQLPEVQEGIGEQTKTTINDKGFPADWNVQTTPEPQGSPPIQPNPTPEPPAPSPAPPGNKTPTAKGVAGKPQVKKSKQIQSEIDDLMKDLDKALGNSLSAIINPEAVAIGTKIVGKYVELGVVKFSEIAQDVYETYGEERFRKLFEAIKAGYGSILATNDNPDFTPYEEFRATKLENFIVETPAEEEVTPTPEPTTAPESKGQKFVDILLSAYEKGNNKFESEFNLKNIVFDLAGDRNSDVRQEIMSTLKGVKMPKAKSGVTAILDEMMKLVDAKGLTKQDKPKANDTGTATNLEPDSKRNTPIEQVGQPNVPTDRKPDNTSSTDGGTGVNEPGAGQRGDRSFSDRIPAPSSEQRDTGLDPEIGPERVGERPGRGTNDNGSSTTNEPGLQPEPNTAKEPTKNTGAKSGKRLSFDEVIKLQEYANRTVPIIRKDKENIRESLPLLMPHQVENVFKAEQRFFSEPGSINKIGDERIDKVNKGIMFTDGTGTGKTITGLGIIKRFERSGVKDILIVVPTDGKVKDWQKEGRLLDIHMKALETKKDGGEIGTISITTYANFRDNEALISRAGKKPFGLVLYDESHNINSNAQGKFTAGDEAHRRLTNPPSVAWAKAKAKYETMWKKAYGPDGNYELRKQVDELITKEQAKIVEETKVVFLSATPFPYHKNLSYADGMLFNIRESMDSGNAYRDFFISNFGYVYKNGQLQAPPPEVDNGINERGFHSKLHKAGAVSSTRLQLDKDYSRDFVLIDDLVGSKIDEGYNIVTDHNEFPLLSEIARKKFNFLYSNQLLEAIKGVRAIERIKEHIALGRKVVVFHSYNNSLPSHPFDFSDPKLWPQDKQGSLIREEITNFNTRYPEFSKLDLRGLKNPIMTMQEAFGDKAVFYNGTVPDKKRLNNINEFNKDSGTAQVFVVQMQAGKEGISLHDITGNKQRVMINLGLPTRPTDAIQTEGRIYRIGQMSDAVIEYPVLHLNFEKNAFAQKISERASTAENLAFGQGARNLKDAYKEGYKNPTTDSPNENQGKGSRDSDAMFDEIDPFDMAKTLYYNRAKRNAKTKSKEGVDYYATPEPLGLKMVEWLYSKPGQGLLEPSAGHGAIGRFFPENTTNKYIEPSGNLRADLSVNISSGNIIEGSFEDHHIVNKYDGIAMNPPYGQSGKTAMEHLVKAMGHLRDGGRVIAILPDGPSMNTRLEKWQESEEAEGFFITAKISLPTVTFERAGTSVKTQILIIDKQTNEGVQKLLPQQKNVDLGKYESITEFFDRIKEMSMPERLQPKSTFKEQVIDTNKDIAPKVDGAIAKAGSYNHTQTGELMGLVKLVKTVDAMEYKRIAEKIKSLGGFWSKYAKGFLFKGPGMMDKANTAANWINNGMDRDPDPDNDSTESSAMRASKGRTPMSGFQTRTPSPTNNATQQPFKIFEAVRDLANRYNPGKTIGEGNTSRGAIGTYFNKSGNIRITGLTDLSVAMHELVHALDYRNNVISNLINTTKTKDAVRKRMTEVYVKYYPNAKPSHDLRTRMVEGYATLVQKYLELPNDIQRDFPDLVADFLTPGGKYWTDVLGPFMQDVQKIIAMYQQLDPLSKMASRISNDTIDQPNKEFLTAADKVTTEMFDKLYPFEEIAKRMGTHFTQDDISLYIRLSSNALQMSMNNVSGKKQRFWAMDSKGEFKEKHQFNYYTLTKSLEKRNLINDFAAYLYARRIKFEYDELKGKEAELTKVNSPQYLAQIMTQMSIGAPEAQKIIDAQSDEINEEIKRLSSILENEGVSEKEAQEAYDAGKDMFKEDEKMFDTLVAEDIEFAHNPLVQLLDDEGYDKFTSREGYAPFKRVIYDELVGQSEDAPTIQGAGTTKVSQFLTRRGSTKAVLNPLLGAMMNHSEVMRKGMKQMVYNKFLAVADKNPTLFQIVPLETSVDSRNRFPQEKNPKIIMARRNYKRVPILVDNEYIKKILDETYDYHNAHLLEHVATSMSQLFRTGTTGIFWQFFINNIFLDQAVSSINTRNGMMPFISTIKQMAPIAFNKLSRGTLFNNSVEAAYLKEYLYLAGTSQTFLSADIEGIKGMEDIVKGKDKNTVNRINNFFDVILKVMSTPGNATEIMTRGTEYILARKAGKPQAVALEEAGRVSAPFHHMGRLGGGTIGKTYVRSIPYFNASLQVFKQTKDSLHTKEGRVRYAFAALSMIAASVSTMLYLLDQDEEDERRKIMRSLPPDSLTKYLFLPNPFSNKRLLQIRIPEQLGWLAGLVNMMIMESKGETTYKWSEYGDAALSFAPQQMNIFDPVQMLFSYVPQVAKPSLEQAFGMKTFPSVRPIETQRDKTLEPEFRYNKYTSPVAIKAGELLGWSPKRIDAFLEGTFGRGIKYLTGKPGIYVVNDIFERELYMEASRQVQFYYETKEKVQLKLKSVEEGLKEYSQDEINKLYAQDSLIFEIQGLLETYKDLNEETQEPLMIQTRNQIFQRIKELEDVTY